MSHYLRLNFSVTLEKISRPHLRIRIKPTPPDRCPLLSFCLTLFPRQIYLPVFEAPQPSRVSIWIWLSLYPDKGWLVASSPAPSYVPFQEQRSNCRTLCGFPWVSLGLLVHWAWKVRRKKRNKDSASTNHFKWDVASEKKDEYPKGFYHKLWSQTIRGDLAFVLHVLRVI